MNNTPPQQHLSLWTAVIINMNAMIGAGIFSVPHALFLHAGPAGIITCILVTLGIWCLAYSFAELARRYPGEGSFYRYASQWGGNIAGSTATLCYLIGMTIGMGLLARVTGDLLYEIIPQAPLMWSIVIIALLALLNVKGLRISTLGQRLLIAATLIPMGIITLLCLLHASPQNLVPFAPHGITALILATKIVIFGFFGFECAASLAPLLANPEQDLPRAITRSVILVGCIYLIFITAIMLALPSTAGHSTASLPKMLMHIMPHAAWLVTLVRFSIISALLGTLHAMLWAASSLLVSLNKQIRVLHPFTSSHGILIISGGIIAAAALITNLDLFFSLTALAVVFAYASALITLVHPRSTPSLPRTTRLYAWLGIFTTALIAASALSGIIETFFT